MKAIEIATVGWMVGLALVAPAAGRVAEAAAVKTTVGPIAVESTTVTVVAPNVLPTTPPLPTTAPSVVALVPLPTSVVVPEVKTPPTKKEQEDLRVQRGCDEVIGKPALPLCPQPERQRDYGINIPLPQFPPMGVLPPVPDGGVCECYISEPGGILVGNTRAPFQDLSGRSENEKTARGL